VALNFEKLIGWRFDDRFFQYQHRDTILYALGLGLGRDPLDRQQLRFVYEHELESLPTMAVVLATPGMWIKNPETGITWQKVLHSAQGAYFHNPLPAAGEVVGTTRVSGIFDRGTEKGALMVVERVIKDAHTAKRYCTLEQTLILRADGGFNGSEDRPPETKRIPDRSPDMVIEWETTPGQAILYRLSGDWNPLHIDPDIARDAGFSRPILHGYCSYGIAGWVLSQAAGVGPAELKGLKCRFTNPVLPGERLQFHIWNRESRSLQFRACVEDRIVLDRGEATFDLSTPLFGST